MRFNKKSKRYSSEKADPDQRNLFAADIEVAEGQLAAAGDAADKALGKPSKRKTPTKRNKGNLEDHLERIEDVIVPENTACPCGCGEMVKVGEEPVRNSVPWRGSPEMRRSAAKPPKPGAPSGKSSPSPS